MAYERTKKTTPKRPGRCLCGLRVACHYTPDNRKLSCEEARELHPRAHLYRRSLLATLAMGVR